jgi:predicted AlkP superfamily phosphohydrolase/phosphomutase
MKKILVGMLLVVVAVASFFQLHRPNHSELKLYWFIPDGVRAEPDLFQVFEWARQGELPNLKRMMDEGAYGYSIPVFPSHTPVNFAALLTGSLPKNNGVADGPMHIEGQPLHSASVGGFSSTARRIPAVWSTFEKLGLKVGIISTPGSTPPEVENGIVVRGRWGNWGIDTPAINFEYVGDNSRRFAQGNSARLFYFGPSLTQYLDFTPEAAHGLSFEAYGQKFRGALVGAPAGKQSGFSRLQIQPEGGGLVSLAPGDWSDWAPVRLSVQGRSFASQVKFHLIKLGPGKFFRFRLFFNGLNETNTQPSSVAEELTRRVGPMVDFVDNYPPQLVHYQEDKSTFLSEMAMSFDWHRKLIPNFLADYRPDAVIHDIYSPNQMLTSRWWMGKVDPAGGQFRETPEEERTRLWAEVKQMYKQLDGMLGEILKKKGENTVVVFSSDHGAAPLRRAVHLNNLFAKNGLLKFKMDPKSGEPIIDWAGSRAVFLKMDGVFIHPDGLQGNWTRAKGPEYLKLRNQVRKILEELKDSDGQKPLSRAVNWEEVPEGLGLPSDRVGYLVIANRPGFGWSEEMSENRVVFSSPLVTGYKQAVLAEETNAMWTPFFIVGPGIRKNHQIKEPFSQIAQLPTILKAMNITSEQKMDGKALDEIFE